MAHLLIHRLRELLDPGCLPVFTSDGRIAYFYALTDHFGQWVRGAGTRWRKPQWQVEAGLFYGQVFKRYRRRKLVRVKPVIRLGTESAFKETLRVLGFSGRVNTAFIERVAPLDPAWRGGAGAPHVGHSEASPLIWKPTSHAMRNELCIRLNRLHRPVQCTCPFSSRSSHTAVFWKPESALWTCSRALTEEIHLVVYPLSLHAKVTCPSMNKWPGSVCGGYLCFHQPQREESLPH
jgi:hypothetical protein